MSPQTQDQLKLTLFGPFEAMIGDRELSGLREHRKAAQLTALLALYGNKALGNEWIATQLWPETGSLDSLGHTVPVLRRALGAHGHRLVAKAGSLLLDLRDAEADAPRFALAREQQGATVTTLREAVELYRGPLLQDWYEPWVEASRRVYHEGYLEMLETLARAMLMEGDVPGARRYLRGLVASGEPADSLHTRVMEALVRTHSHLQAMRLYEEYRDQLRAGYGMEPPDTMTALYNRLPRAVSVFVPEFAPDLQDAEPVGGAMPLDSRFYVRRADDELFHASVARCDAIICVKGPRQVGKTSLLARGLEQARQNGARIAVTDFQTLEPAEKQTIESFYLALANNLAEQLELATPPAQAWSPLLSAGANFERYLRREALTPSPEPLVWAIDEADAIFDCDYRSSVFGLFRSWYNARALNPQSVWGRFVQILAYSTEAHLLISNLSQSPFNVGTRFALQDFSADEVAELNRRYGAPLSLTAEIPRLIDLVGGNPFLVRLCLHEIKTRKRSLAEIEATADHHDSLFAEHLEHLRSAILRDPALIAAVRDLLHGALPLSQICFLRLRAAGILAGADEKEARFRCRLYETYLRRHLP
jgi:DNA-binding SARP family transcriptional activator